MDASTKKMMARREAFQDFLHQMRYTPQGRHSRAGRLEDADVDALLRGDMARVWAWTCANVKNAEDMALVHRNVEVARYGIASCQRERAEARERRAALASRRQHLATALTQARARERSLLKALRSVEKEEMGMHAQDMETRHRDLLGRGYKEAKAQTMAVAGEMVETAVQLVSKAEERGETKKKGEEEETKKENQVQVLLREFARMTRTVAPDEQDRITFGDGDIEHLRGFSGDQLMAWLLEEDPPQKKQEEGEDEADEEEAYADHVASQTRSSHEALLHVQELLRTRQHEQIAHFLATQQMYAKAQSLAQRVDQERTSRSTPDSVEYELWGHTDMKVDSSPSPSPSPAQVVELEAQSHVLQTTLACAREASQAVTNETKTLQTQQHVLQDKVTLMQQFEERQRVLVAQMRAVFRHNQELLTSMGHKKDQLLAVMREDVQPRVETASEAALATYRQQVMEELRLFASLRLTRLERVHVDTHGHGHVHGRTVNMDEHGRYGLGEGMPREELYLRQLDACSRGESPPSQRDAVDGFPRLVRGLGLPEHADWSRVLRVLQPPAPAPPISSRSSSYSLAEEVSHEMAALEREVSTDRGETMPNARGLLMKLRAMHTDLEEQFVPRLSHLTEINAETKAATVPQLQQAIENWYHQQAWQVVALPAEQSPAST